MISPAMTKVIGILPKGLVSFLSKVLLNKYMNKHANIIVHNKTNLNLAKKPVLFVCNHLSNSDALVLNKVLKEHDVTFVAGVKLKSNSLTNLGMSIVKTTPVHPNSADKEGIKKIINIIKGGNNVLIFPEGTRSRISKMIKAKKGVILIARMCKVQIVPIGIWGTEQLLPINKEGKMEQEKFHNADVNINIGKSFELPKKMEDESKKEYDERTLEYIMKNIAELIPENYRGEYI